jgi:hypothetical protein
MELAIRPAELHAAAVALAACAARLDDAALTFARSVQADLPELGMKALAASARGVSATEQAVQVLGSDIHRLSLALQGLAQHYPRVDETAVPQP